jgi:hypothetical protein
MRNLVKDIASVMSNTVHEDLSTRDGRVYQEVLDESDMNLPSVAFRQKKADDKYQDDEISGHRGKGRHYDSAMGREDREVAAERSRKPNHTSAKYYHEVPFADKSHAKAEGMKFDGDKKKWYHTSQYDSSKSKFKRHFSEDVLDEAKWETPPNTPFKDIKKGDTAYFYDPNLNDKSGNPTHPGKFKTGHFTGAVRKGEKDRNGHLQMKGHDPKQPYELHWIHPDHVFKSTGDAAKGPRPVKEATEGTDHVTMTVPLLIRIMEWSHEEAKDDVAIHKFVENVVAKGGVLETDDYEDFLK